MVPISRLGAEAGQSKLAPTSRPKDNPPCHCRQIHRCQALLPLVGLLRVFGTCIIIMVGRLSSPSAVCVVRLPAVFGIGIMVAELSFSPVTVWRLAVGFGCCNDRGVSEPGAGARNACSMHVYLCMSVYVTLYRLSIHPSIDLSADIPIYLSIFLSISTHPSIHPSIHPSVRPSVCLLSIYLPLRLPVYLFIYLSIYLPIHLSIYKCRVCMHTYACVVASP